MTFNWKSSNTFYNPELQVNFSHIRSCTILVVSFNRWKATKKEKNIEMKRLLLRFHCSFSARRLIMSVRNYRVVNIPLHFGPC